MQKVLIISKYFCFLLLFYILNCANIQGIHPFAFGLFFALVWCNQKIYILAPLYLLASFLCFGSLEHLIIDLITVGVFLIAFFLHYKFKKRLNPILIGMYAFLSQFGLLYTSSQDPYLLWNAILTLIIGLICLYAYLHLFQGIALKGIRRKYTLDEIVCFAVFAFAIGAGLYCVPFGEYVYLGISALIILFCAYIFGATQSLLVATFLGLGCAFASEQFLILSHTLFLSLGASATICTKRVYSAIAVVFIDIISGLYFLPFYSLEHLISVLVGVLLFLLIPKKIISNFNSYVIKDKEDIAVRTIINRNRQSLCARLYELSEVFYDIKNVFSGMVQNNKDFQELSPFIVESVKQKNCALCPKNNECLRMYLNDTNNGIYNLLNLAFERGRASMIEVTPYLAKNCTRLSILIASVNNLVDEYKSNIQAKNNLDSGKILLSEQMWGVSQIMKSLATEVSLNVTFDTTKEYQIVEELMYVGVLCSEAIVYQQQDKICSATLVIKNCDVSKIGIDKSVSKVLGLEMEVVSISKAEKAGFSVVIMQNKNNFDVTFGSAGAVKADSKKSGDTHSVVKLSQGKILMALCDGMGSGEEAQNTSSLALGLIENFYKAGFDNNLILTSVNKLLSLGGDETFSALDICVFDLFDGTCDIIKVGSPASFIKAQNAVQQVEASALPLGILEELHPNIRSFVLNENDMIIFATDGIIDSFASLDDLRNLINEIDTTNPQIVANQILSKALQLNNSIPADDMTVLVGRIWHKI